MVPCPNAPPSSRHLTLGARAAAYLAGLVVLFGCGSFPSLGGTGTDGGTGSSGASSSASTAGGADAGAKGIDCITEGQTGATLCTGISTCPGLAVDHDVFPNCGFRPGGTVLDLECACQTSLCPLGVAKTCDDVKKLLAAQNETTVCTQIGEGRCTGGGAPATASTATHPNCDKQCASECAGAPGCIAMCGC
ncbi:MAG: hypothetical protein U0235_01320 [Polyangiaceae bacterium]